MDIALLNEKITIQKSTVVTDAIGNHKNSWADVFTCYATAGGESGSESETAGQTVENDKVSLTVRYSSETAAVEPTTHRIIFHDEIYDITNIDHQNYKKKSLKFWCQKARR